MHAPVIISLDQCKRLIYLIRSLMLALRSRIGSARSKQLFQIRFASSSSGEKEKLVILGSGWGGYNLAW